SEMCIRDRGFPGTITVDHDALREFVRCLLVSFHENGFAGVLILTGHAGGQHLCALEEACQAALDASTLSVSLVSLFDLIDPRAVETPGDGHSGEIETSLMMHIAGGLVSGLPEGHFPDRPRFLIQRSVRHLMGDGIMGDPARASPDKGRAFFEMAVEGVIRALDELESALARPWSGP
ncbi:MAG: creatininase family protein, partial [Methanothrix sp.]|nr:creatininase family protein [Methanothrix sp.]